MKNAVVRIWSGSFLLWDLKVPQIAAVIQEVRHPAAAVPVEAAQPAPVTDNLTVISSG